MYRYYGDEMSLDQVIAETRSLDEGGTLAVMLACHALRRGYTARIHTYNLGVFDPSWFADQEGALGPRLEKKLRRQAEVKSDPKLLVETRSYLEFLELGGEIRFQDLNAELIRKHLRRGQPILTGVSATYLYHCSREIGATNQYDDVLGEPAGHFVVLAGYDRHTRKVLVADPLGDNPTYQPHNYEVGLDRLVGAILLGILTFDANFLVLEPDDETPGRTRVDSRRR